MRAGRSLRHTWASIVWLGAVLCNFAAGAVERVKDVEPRTPVSAAGAGDPKRINYVRTVGDTTDLVVGSAYRGTFCSKVGEVRWTKQWLEAVGATVNRIMRSEILAAGYKGIEQRESAFASEDRQAPDFELAGLIKEFKIEFCDRFDREGLGGVWVSIQWELFAPKLQRVVFKSITEGSFQTESKVSGTATNFIEKAVTVAARNLLAQPEFVAALSGATQVAAESKSLERLAILSRADGNARASEDIPFLRSAVVTIESGVGSGSGFFVSTEGYLLTNHHVVGDAKYVKIILSTGRTLVGEVIRSDRRRDLAVVKTESVQLRPFRVSAGAPEIGSEVFVIGSPLGRTLSGTVARGILSSRKEFDGMEFLLSDAKILPGNSGSPMIGSDGAVIGIASMGIGSWRGESLGVYVPMPSALDVLKIDYGN